MKLKAALFGSFCAVTFGAHAQLAQWNFNVQADNSDLRASTVNTLTTPIASYIGGTFGSTNSGTIFATGASGGTGDKAWNVTHFPASGTASGTAGAQFAVNTSGFKDITVSYNERHSATAANTELFQYSLDGSSFTTFQTFTYTGTTFVARSVDLSSISGANNNPNFEIRMVSAFSGGNYAVTSGAGAYSTAGTWRFDDVTFTGTVSVVPEPQEYAALFAGGLVAFAIYRRRAAK